MFYTQQAANAIQSVLSREWDHGMELSISLANDINSHIQTDNFSREKVGDLANRLSEILVQAVSCIITLS